MPDDTKTTTTTSSDSDSDSKSESKSNKQKWPSKDEVSDHVQRDEWVWDEETGWNPPK